MYLPTYTIQTPIQCDTVAERDALLNDPRYQVAGLSVAVSDVVYWLGPDLRTWEPQGASVVLNSQRYPNCKYVVANPATWNHAATSAAELLDCSSVAIGDRVLCPSGTNVGIWKASSATAFVRDSGFTPMRGWTVLCTDVPGSVTYLQTAADQAATAVFVKQVSTTVAPSIRSNELFSALAHWDANTPAQLAVAPLQLTDISGWTLAGLTAQTGKPDHFGGFSAIGLVDDTATQVRTVVFSGADTEAGCAARHGHLSFECWFKPINKAAIWYTDFANSTNSLSVTLPDAAPDDATSMCYLYPSAKDPTDYVQWKQYPDGWYRVRWRGVASRLNATAPYYWNRILTTSYAGTNGETVRLSGVKFSQDRVKSWTSSSGVALTQATDDIRPVAAPVWLNDQVAIVEGRETTTACSLSSSVALGTTWSLAAIVYTHILTPATTARSVITLTGSTASISLQIDPTGVWKLSRTDNAGATLTQLTTQPAPAVPVCVGLVATATTLTLYIDGIAASGGVLTYSNPATITGVTVFGGNSYSILRSLAVDTADWTTSIKRVSGDLRTAAALPDQWPVDVLTGQSNANSNKGTPNFWCGSGWRNGPGRAFFLNDYNSGYTVAGNWYPGTIEVYNSTSHGPRVGVANEGDDQSQYRPLICCAKGGTLLSDWITAGRMGDMLNGTITAALAALGTTLRYVDTIYLIQGEAEAGTARSNSEVTNYLTTMQAFAAQERAAWGANVHFVIHRLNAGLVVDGVTYISNDLVQVAQDAFVASSSLNHMSRLDGRALIGDDWHYTARAATILGRNLLRARLGLPLLPGNWSG